MYYITFITFIFLAIVYPKVVYIPSIISDTKILDTYHIQFTVHMLSKIDMPLKGYYLLINSNLLEQSLILLTILISLIYDKVKIKIKCTIESIKVSIRHYAFDYLIAKEPITCRISKIVSNRGAQIYTYNKHETEILEHLCIIYRD